MMSTAFRRLRRRGEERRGPGEQTSVAYQVSEAKM
jgi:hypothetical protein